MAGKSEVEAQGVATAARKTDWKKVTILKLNERRGMSQVELCHFWCLLDGEGEAFSAEAGLEWNVEQLAKAIREVKSDLREFDPSKIVLLKLNEPIPVDPEESLLQRLPQQIDNSSVKLRRTDQVSDIFPD